MRTASLMTAHVFMFNVLLNSTHMCICHWSEGGDIVKCIAQGGCWYLGGGVCHHTYNLSLEVAVIITNLRTKQVSVDRDTKITLILTKARSLLESSAKDLTQPTLVTKIQHTCPLTDIVTIAWCWPEGYHYTQYIGWGGHRHFPAWILT